MFPIGVGPDYDRTELSVLGRHGKEDNSLHLNSMDQLRMLLTLDNSYTERICRGTLPRTHTHTLMRICHHISTLCKWYELCFLAGPPGVCVDDNGNERKVSNVC